jgi:hypothetical protein
MNRLLLCINFNLYRFLNYENKVSLNVKKHQKTFLKHRDSNLYCAIYSIYIGIFNLKLIFFHVLFNILKEKLKKILLSHPHSFFESSTIFKYVLNAS